MRQQTADRLMQGLFAGFLGFLTIAFVFGITNIVAGRSPFYTAAVLGASMVYGVKDVAQMSTSIAPYVFAYTGLHMLAFLILGLIGSWLATIADRGYMLWYPGLFFFLFVAFHLFGALQLVAGSIQSALSSASIWVAGFLGAAVMFAYLLHEHPYLRTHLGDADE